MSKEIIIEEITESLGNTNNSPLDELLERIPDTPEKEVETHLKEHSFYIKDGCYYTKEQRSRKEGLVERKLSNCVWAIKKHLDDGTNNTKRILTIQKESELILKEVLSSELKPEPFLTILHSNGCVYYGDRYTFLRILEKEMDHEEKAVIIDQLGYVSEFDFYVFADAIHCGSRIHKADKLGLIKINQKEYYLPAFGFATIKDEKYEKARKYKFRGGHATFNEWAKLFYLTFGGNAAIGIIYTLSAVYRDIIFKTAGFFPYLFEYGEPGTGKTSFTYPILSLFGEDTVGSPVNNTSIVGISRTANQLINSVIYLKEYTAETSGPVQDVLLTAYDGAGRVTGIKSNDNSTKTHHPRSAMILDGNNLPNQKNAVLSRMWLLHFDRTKFSDEETRHFNQLKEFAQSGLGAVLKEILDLRHLMVNQFRQAYLEQNKELKQYLRSPHSEIGMVDERLVNHASLALAVFRIFKNRLEFPFSEKEFKSIVFESIREQNSLLRESSVQTIWWEAFAFNIRKGVLVLFNGLNRESAHFQIKSEGDKFFLQLKFSDVWVHYMNYCKQNNIIALDKSSIKSTLCNKNNPDFIPSNQRGRGLTTTDREFGSVYEFWIEQDEEKKKLMIAGVELPISKNT